MCTVDLSPADPDMRIEASANLSTADLFVTAVTRDWKSLATSRLPLLHRFKYVFCRPVNRRPVYRRPIIILGSKSLPNKRNSRGFQFAKLYYDVGDYESGKRYVQAFLSVRESVPQAHKLMGQIYEAVRDKQRAVESYKRSLDLDPEQKDLVLKVCELYSDSAVPVNKDNARFWIEQAEKYYPNHFIVFKLKERVLEVDGRGDAAELEHLISAELVKNPQDVKLHVKLLRLYIQSRDVDRAYDHAVQTEKTLAFIDSIEWYECLTDMYQVYQDQKSCNGDSQFYTQKLFALANLAFLRLTADDRDMISCVKVIHQLDIDLNEASQPRKQSAEWDAFLTEMTGQLFFLIGTLLLKRAAKGQVSWKDACSFSAVCYLLSDSFPAINCKSSWFNHVSPDRKKFYERLYMNGCDRLSQGGHMIYSLLSKQDGSLWARKLRQKLCTQDGKKNLFALLFTSGEMKQRRDRSYLLQSDKFTGTNLDVPSKAQISQYDAVAYTLHCDNLNHLVWLALHHHSQRDTVQPDYEQVYGYQLFKDMKYSVPDLTNGDPGTLCQLDVQTFFYATVHWAAVQRVERSRNLHPIPDKPDTLPVCLSPTLATQQQSDWWSAVYRLENKTASDKFSKLWGILMRGLETVRLVAPHTLPLNIIIHVAQTLDQRAKETESLDAEGIVTPKLSGLQSRAGFYWKAAANLLSRLERGQPLRMPKDCLFPGEMTADSAQMKELKEQAKFAMAVVAMREGKHEEALNGFETLYQPQASYYTGLIFKDLAESVDINGNSSTNENSQQMALLQKSKSSFYQALDRLGSDKDELKDDITRNLDDVVCKLISLESGGALVDSILSANSQNYSTAESEVESEEEPKQATPQKKPSPQITPVLPKSVQMRQPVYPSPTRLEAQMKALETSHQAQTNRMTTLEDTVQKLIQELLIQLRESREENKFLREQLQLSSQQGASMSMFRSPMPQFPGTPQTRGSLMNQMNQQYQSPSQFGFGAQGAAVPGHMSQYGYGIGSPARPGSGFEQADVEDDYNNVDGEYYDPEEQGQFYVPDSSLVQDWPFGHKAGVEGKSTITYAPQARGNGQTDPGMFANALRGQSIQYGGYPQQQQGVAARPSMPGPGFFAQPQQPSQPAVPPQVSGQQMGMMGLAGQSPSMSPRPPTQLATAISKPPTTSIMPPNAVASPSVTTKPRLIPESVGVPSPKPGEKLPAQSTTLSQQQGSKSIFSKPAGQAQAPASQAPPTSASLLASLLTDPKLAAQSASMTPGSASSILSSIAAKHQQETSQSQPSTPATTAAQTTPQKTVFSGFSFTSTPKITEPKVKEEPKPPVSTAPEPKPFGGFSFTLPSKPTTSAPVTNAGTPTISQPVKATTTAASPFVIGQNSLSPSFAAVAAGGTSTNAFQASGDFKGFQGAGQAIFGKSPSPQKGDKSLDDEHVDEYEPEVDFKPIVPLPALVKVKTGEEDEEKMFSERTKLFRFDTETKQWKERGIGELKILKHKVSKKVRILMRREQVLKVCANHTLKKDMKLTPMSSSDKAWCWNATDYAEGEMKHEQFAAKFKNSDIASKFKEVFEDCQAAMTSEEGQTEVGAPKPKQEEQSEKGNLSSLFKQKAGSWKCNGCLIVNDSGILKCPCCGTLKPGVKPEDIKEEKPSAGFGTTSSGSGFKFGSTASTGAAQTGSGFKFGSQPGPATTATAGSQPATGFKFGSVQTTAGSTATAAAGQPATGFKFGGVQSTADSTSAKPGGFKFGIQPSDEAESARGTEDKTDSSKSTDTSKQATSAGFAVDKASTKYTFGSDTKTTVSKPDIAKSDESEACDTKPNLLAHLLETEGDMWKCDKCLVNNDEKELKCVCCAEPKPGTKSDTAQGPAASTLAKFGAQPGSGFNIGAFGGSSDVSGFSFGSPQVSSTTKADSKPKPAAFSFGDTSKKTEGFSFGTPGKLEAFKFEPDKVKDKPGSVSSEGFNFSMSMTPTMPHAGRSPLKSPGVTSPKSPGSDDGYYVTHEGDDSHIYFEPLIPLPEKVEVKTGEEEEDVIFSHRAKLFRFAEGQWKERGLGDIKVLYNNDDNKARILMRREQILKICCNHYITKDLTLKIMPNSNDRALVWYAIDFADGEQKTENFSVRFKTAENAFDFKAAVDDAKLRISGEKTDSPMKEKAKSSSISVPKIETIGAKTTDDVIFLKEETATPEEIQKARQYLLPDNFYMYLRKPPCPGCIGCDDENFGMKKEVVEEVMTVKKQDSLQAVKEIMMINKQDVLEAEKYSEDVSYVEGEDEGDLEENDDDYEDENEEDEDSDDEYETEEEEDDENDDDGPGIENVTRMQQPVVETEKFGGQATQDADNVETLGGAVFGGGTASGFSFSSLAAVADPNAFGGNRDDSKQFTWQGAGKKLFGQGDEEGSGGEEEEGVAHSEDPHFEPIVPLPDLVEVKTGEEEETAVFRYRAKLFRFDKDANQWKEKGIGEMKILCHKETGKHRLLLRREQVHKLACNHLLTPELSFRPLNTSETSWCWTAQDYSDMEPRIEQLAVRFKTIEQAREFKDKIDEIQDAMKSTAVITWNVNVYTSDISKAGTDAKVGLCLYGEKGQSDEIILDSKKEFFEKGRMDSFKVDIANVGRPYKLRVYHDNKGRGNGWHLNKIEMESVATNEKYVFPCDRWLADDEDDYSVVRELPAQGTGIQSPLPVDKYVIQVYTGDISKAGTDANVYITVFGERGDTGVRQLAQSKTHKNKFERGNMDEFEVEAVSLLELKKIRIGHDGSGFGAGWFLDKVVIKQIGEPIFDKTFLCERWLAKDMDDKLIEREIIPSDS